MAIASQIVGQSNRQLVNWPSGRVVIDEATIRLLDHLTKTMTQELRPLGFDPHQIAYAEAAGWRAYYDRNWLKLLQLIVRMSEAQFGIPFPYSWQAAYYIVRASVAWRPVDHDLRKVQMYLRRYYELAARFASVPFNPARAADLEVAYWEVHRRLSMAGQADKTEFIEVLTRLHAELFGLPVEQARESAEWRVMANNVVDTITTKISTDPEADWARLEDYLRRCYHSLVLEIDQT